MNNSYVWNIGKCRQNKGLPQIPSRLVIICLLLLLLLSYPEVLRPSPWGCVVSADDYDYGGDYDYGDVGDCNYDDDYDYGDGGDYDYGELMIMIKVMIMIMVMVGE